MQCYAIVGAAVMNASPLQTRVPLNPDFLLICAESMTCFQEPPLIMFVCQGHILSCYRTHATFHASPEKFL